MPYSPKVEIRNEQIAQRMKQIFLILLILLLGHLSLAAEEGQIRFGIQGGHVGLTERVGEYAEGALGGGVLFNYAMSDEMMFEVGYIQSSHKNLKHSDANVGINFYFNSYDAAYFHATAGVDFISHELTAVSLSSNGFAVYAGLGVDFEMGRNFAAGLQGRYHKAFDTSVQLPTGLTEKAIQSYSTIMLRLMFVIPKS